MGAVLSGVSVFFSDDPPVEPLGRWQATTLQVGADREEDYIDALSLGEAILTCAQRRRTPFGDSVGAGAVQDLAVWVEEVRRPMTAATIGPVRSCAKMCVRLLLRDRATPEPLATARASSECSGSRDPLLSATWFLADALVRRLFGEDEIGHAAAPPLPARANSLGSLLWDVDAPGNGVLGPRGHIPLAVEIPHVLDTRSWHALCKS